MTKIICPNCNTEFEISEGEYLSIVNQVRDAEFNNAVAKETANLRDKSQAELRAEKAKLDLERSQEAIAHEKQLAECNRTIEQLQAQLDSAKLQSELRISDAEKENAKHIAELTTQLSAQKTLYESQLKDKDEQIGYYKDLKAKLSTKMVGETLEQHCETEFNKIRTAAFPHAYFEKDNDIRTGSKGDYIFRDYDGDTELVSIMFEMKNESDTTATKHKNEDFFKELDKDRNEKGCEYAVLVSLLEQDNEQYTGIADVSYRYPKMYVIRPQFFIPLITLLRNAAQGSAVYKKQLALAQKENVDVTLFEEKLQEFQSKFGKNYRLASEKFHSAIEEIDKSISHLQKVRDALTGSANNLRLANEKAQELSVRKLAKDSPSLLTQLDENK